MYDIIGDIHGHADRLKELLVEMGYEPINGIWQHPTRTLISVGDLVDRGPQQRESVDIIRNMVEANKALCIMGNHEFNAVAYATKDSNGNFLREHSEKNFGQHEAFLVEAEADPAWYQSTIDWFKSLPMYLDLPTVRVVHACWHEQSLAVFKKYSQHGVLNNDAWIPATTKGHELYNAIEVLCKGWEVPLPKGYAFLDKDKNERTDIRTQWWKEDATDYRSLAIGVKDTSTLPDTPIPGDAMPGYDSQKPLFVGHYWMKGQPSLQSKTIACVDWSVAKNGLMVGYRFNDGALSNTDFIAV